MGVGLLRDFGADYFPRTDEIALGGPVLWLLSGLTAASALLFGLVPSVHGSGGPVDESLRSMGRSSTGSVAVRRLRQVLVGTQFAIATPLLVVAGLLLVSLDALGRVNLGFDTHNLLSGSISLPAVEYAEPGRVATFWGELQRRVEALPGVSGVTFADGRPPDDVGNFNNFDLEDSPTPPGTIATGHAVGVRDAGVLSVFSDSRISKDVSSTSATASAPTSKSSSSIGPGRSGFSRTGVPSANGSAKEDARPVRGPRWSVS